MNGGGGMSSQLGAMKANNKAALFWCVCLWSRWRGKLLKIPVLSSPPSSPWYIFIFSIYLAEKRGGLSGKGVC